MGARAHARLALTRRVTMKLEDEIYSCPPISTVSSIRSSEPSVESALLTNPALAGRLRQLTVVRDLNRQLYRALTLHEDLSAADCSGPRPARVAG